MNSPSPTTATDGSEPALDLKNPGLAAFLAWLWPGAGHLYQGRTAKGLIYMLCILGIFFYGMYLGQGRVVFVYGSWRPEFFRWPFVCQVAAGLPALPALVQAKMPGVLGEWYMPPADAVEFDALHKRLNRYFELGTVFTMIAGLLNVLAIYDAWGGPAYIADKPKEEPSDEKADEPAAAV